MKTRVEIESCDSTPIIPAPGIESDDTESDKIALRELVKEIQFYTFKNFTVFAKV